MSSTIANFQIKSGISVCHQKRFEKAFSASFSYSLLLLHKRLTFLQQIDDRIFTQSTLFVMIILLG